MKGQISLIFILGILLLGCSTPIDEKNVPETPIAIAEAETNFPGQMLPVEAQAIMGGETIDLEVTKTPQQQALGLMFRESLPDNRGMLFTFNPPRPTQFWMKNVKISLDMIFVRNGEIKAIAANVPPCTSDPCPTYGTEQLIDTVIELRGGRAAELGLKAGSPVKIEFLTPSTNTVN
ncbi:MAG: DUF192 domain-containing protein [Oscillatoria sp. PMC 1051.18]|uniref:DUF192 domain-containing protein n=1 Tax=Oscillatoria salina TaxID=331517 RepID=UPI0013BB5BC6|nr:DUF192 domain-containing protein [Oscillatoria salina]MBZ8179318.1 DUF192 domain-containing protein [Oscillatoria salina IIICB1]MEC4894373.1 DUF192 domain-containing protein [Oscillatoria sp. PMC 1050.18]MEC5031825.1 DUF192 domain-containing protein [Oscillatoria sp. PMC 1051.18]NET87648.1 DUF192 domain-containing protein [Kamptonema sp. SIO1D9]